MDEGKFAAEFVSKNIEIITKLAIQAFGKADEIVQIKLKTAYGKYLENTQKKYSKSKSFFIRHEPVDLYTYYVPTALRCGRNSVDEASFAGLIEISKRIVVTGSGGCGKSVLMKHLFLDCIKDNKYAPVLIELRDLNADGKTLDDAILQTLDAFDFKVEGDYVKRAKTAGHFCYFFDGYDEISPNLKISVMREISALAKKFPECPIFVSSRPDDIFNGVEDFSIFSILALKLSSAIKLVEHLPFDSGIKKKFAADLKSGLFEKHESFLSNPLLLSIMLLTYGENAEIPSKLSIFYNQAYEALFQRHDAYKGGFNRARTTSLDIQDFARVFSLFSLQTYERRILKMSKTQCLEFIEKCQTSLTLKFKADDYLSDSITAACLLLEDGLEIAFSHRSFQEYFVARHISSAPPQIQEKLVNRYWKNLRSDAVIQLLLEINSDLVERLLLLPKLEQLFLDLGVSRKIGVTHTIKYFKKTYSKLSIEEDGIRATFLEEEVPQNAVLRMAINHCGTYSFPDKAHFEEFHKEFLKKHGSSAEVTEYSSKKLTSRSAVLVDLASSGGAFSIEYLAAGYAAYKALKNKHSNALPTLDSLLGIKN